MFTGSTLGRRYILFHKTSIPALPLVQSPIQCYTCTLKSPVTLRHVYYYLRNIHVYSPTNHAVFHSLTTFTLIFSSRPTLIFAALQATTVEPVASKTASKLHRYVSRNGPVLKVWPADNYGSCGVLEEEQTKIFITLKEIRTETKNMLLFFN